MSSCAVPTSIVLTFRCPNFLLQFDAVFPSDNISQEVDSRTEESYLRQELGALTQACTDQGIGAQFRAIRVPGDGNCLTHSISRAVLGVELLYHVLRQEMRDELAAHAEWYATHTNELVFAEEAGQSRDQSLREVFPESKPKPVLSLVALSLVALSLVAKPSLISVTADCHPEPT